MATLTGSVEVDVRESFCTSFADEVLADMREVLGGGAAATARIEPVRGPAQRMGMLLLRAMASPALEEIDKELEAQREQLARGLAEVLGASVMAAFFGAVRRRLGRGNALVAGTCGWHKRPLAPEDMVE